MVVVAIIGLLSSVAIPGFRIMVLRSKRAERTINMKAIAMTLQAYAATNEGRMPTPAISPFNPPTPVTPVKKAWQTTPAYAPFNQIDWSPDGYVYYHYRIWLSGNTFFYVDTYGDLDGDNNYWLSYDCWQLYGDLWTKTCWPQDDAGPY
jgi:type II secretory pathway pseudopilin PulG